MLSAVTVWGIWWYVVIHQQADARAMQEITASIKKQVAPAAPAASTGEEKPQEMGINSTATEEKEPEGLPEMGSPELLEQGAKAPADAGPPKEFFVYFWLVGAHTLVLAWLLEARRPSSC
jgi:hypothetical protein